MKKFNVAVIGASGIVGKELLLLLEKFPIKNIKLFGSKNKNIIFKNKKIKIKKLYKKDLNKNFDFIFFIAGSKISKTFIPHVNKKNTFIIDLSSHFRLKKNIPLIIPEINFKEIFISLKNKKQKLIASPNCTATIMLMALFPLKDLKIKRIIASTYQAASGGGKKLLEKLEKDTFENNDKDPFSYNFNLFLHNSPLNKNKYCQEEVKIEKEIKKILKDNSIKISVTSVRVPVKRCHSISLNVEFEKRFSIKKIFTLLQKFPNITVLDQKFATPLLAQKKQNIFISRIRKDISNKNTLEMFIVGDQLLKGAALNAFQIAEKLSTKFL